MIEKLVLDGTGTGDLPIFNPDALTAAPSNRPIPNTYDLIIFIIIWFGDTVTVTHLTKCNT